MQDLRAALRRAHRGACRTGPACQATSSPSWCSAGGNGRSRKAFMRSSKSRRSLLTLLLPMPDRPIACTGSPTRLVETPLILSTRFAAQPAVTAIRKPFPRAAAAAGTMGSSGPAAASGSGLQRGQTHVERATLIAVARGRAVQRALTTRVADDAVNVSLRQQLHHCLRHVAHNITVSDFGRQLGRR